MELNIKEIQKYGTEMLKTVVDICETYDIKWFMAYGSALGAVRHNGPIPWDCDIDIYILESELNRFLDIMEKELPNKYWIDFRKNVKKPRSFPRIGLSGYDTEVFHIDVFRLGGMPKNNLNRKIFALKSRILYIIWKSKTLDIMFYYPDTKRRIIAYVTKFITSPISINTVIKWIDKQGNKISLNETDLIASPITSKAKYALKKEIFEKSILIDYEDFKVRVPEKYDEYLKVHYGDYMKFPPEEIRNAEMSKKFIIRKIK